MLETLRRHGMQGRALVSTTFSVTTRRLALLAPSVPRAIGYPRDRYGVARFHWPAPLTRLGAAALARGDARPRAAAAPHGPRRHDLRCTTRSARRPRSGRRTAPAHPCSRWTANDAQTVRRLARPGVDAIVSDDPGMALRTLATLLRAVKRLLAAGLFVIGLAVAGGLSGPVIADVTTSTSSTTATTTAATTTVVTTTTTAVTTTTPPSATIPRGVRVAGVRVGGLTAAEAVAAVQAAFATPLPVVVDRRKLVLDPRAYRLRLHPDRRREGPHRRAGHERQAGRRRARPATPHLGRRGAAPVRRAPPSTRRSIFRRANGR